MFHSWSSYIMMTPSDMIGSQIAATGAVAVGVMEAVKVADKVVGKVAQVVASTPTHRECTIEIENATESYCLDRARYTQTV